MAYASYEDYRDLYGPEALDEAGFSRLLWEAERIMDQATTGVDGVQKLRTFRPAKASDRAAVRRCACALTDTLGQLEAASEELRRSQTLLENADGTLQSRQITARTAGSESITYAAAAGAQSGGTAARAAAGDPAARQELLEDILRRYLSGAADANGVHLLYLGPYPRKGA